MENSIVDELLSLQVVNLARFARNVEWDYFAIFNKLLFTQNVARFARNVEWDFLKISNTVHECY